MSLAPQPLSSSSQNLPVPPPPRPTQTQSKKKRKQSVVLGTEIITRMEILEKQKDRLISRFFQERRHTEDIQGYYGNDSVRDCWRKFCTQRMKTVSVALVFCLHIGVDPPDPEPKPKECAKLEGWQDPFACSASRAITKIAQSVKSNYESWQPRARYHILTDPTSDEVHKKCVKMRQNARDDRILFHYNGHGVPRPTQNGEIWVFNQNYTQYIPLSLIDLMHWMGKPSVYVWDCNAAGTIFSALDRIQEDSKRNPKMGKHGRRERAQMDDALPATSEFPPQHFTTGGLGSSPSSSSPSPSGLENDKEEEFPESIHLAACQSDQKLPTNPQLPADLFTCCLTTPIQTSIIWYLVHTGRRDQFPSNFIDILLGPTFGMLNDRKTIMGELNWIFTAITDTIAWNTLPMSTFQRLFRQDLLLASLFRCFILSEKIMGENGCNVKSIPELPPTADHPLWESWLYTLDLTLNQMYNMIVLPKENLPLSTFTKDLLHRELVFAKSNVFMLNNLIDVSGLVSDAEERQHNSFFIEQLKAFEVWLEYGCERHSPPQQLPVVLQVLLSQAHRLLAVQLLARFLDLGQWAVSEALSVGIFPYVQKLLQLNSKELRQWLAFIWAKILAVEPSCQTELFKEIDETSRQQPNKHSVLRYFYFIHILNDPETTPKQKIVPAFILASLFHGNYRVAQENLTNNGYVNLCTELLNDPAAKKCRLLKLWVLIGLGRLWADFDNARWQAVRLNAYKTVIKELDDDAAEVRAAAVYAIGCLVRNRSEGNEHASTVDEALCDKLCNKCTLDGSLLVRVELVCALQWYVLEFIERFAKILLMMDEKLELKLAREDAEDSGAVDVAATLTEAANKKEANTMRIFRKASMMFDSSSKPLDAKQFEVTGVVSDLVHSPFRNRIFGQISHLETKNFLHPLERTYLALLRLCVDPCLKVSKSAQQLLEKIEEQAVLMKNGLSQIVSNISLMNMSSTANPYVKFDHSASSGDESVEADSEVGSVPKSVASAASPRNHNEVIGNGDVGTGATGGAGVRFVVGSPIIGSNGTPIASNHGSLERSSTSCTPLNPHPQRKLSMPTTSTPTDKKRERGNRDKPLPIKIMQPGLNFTPKRNITGKAEWSNAPSSKKSENRELIPVINSEFVDWCSHTFIEPILDRIQANEDDDGDRMITRTIPTDWAYHTKEGMEQAASDDFVKIREKERCDFQLATYEACGVRAMAMSTLRKVLYFTDGDWLNILRYETKCSIAHKFLIGSNNQFCLDRTTEIIVINDISREMLLCGSDAGIIRVWDLCYNMHSHDFESTPSVVSSAGVLSDQLLTPVDKDMRTNCMYSWSQINGRLTCSGNVPVIRIWDAHYEKTVQDIPISPRRGAITAIDSDLDHSNFIAVGYRTGAIHVHDTRLPTASSIVLSYEDHPHRVTSAMVANKGKMVVSAHENGIVTVFDPRVFQEPLWEKSLHPLDTLANVQVHSKGDIMACTTVRNGQSEINVLDSRLHSVGSMATNQIVNQPLSRVHCVTMHKMRALIGVADDNYVSIYSRRNTIL